MPAPSCCGISLFRNLVRQTLHINPLVSPQDSVSSSASCSFVWRHAWEECLSYGGFRREALKAEGEEYFVDWGSDVWRIGILLVSEETAIQSRSSSRVEGAVCLRDQEAFSRLVNEERQRLETERHLLGDGEGKEEERRAAGVSRVSSGVPLSGDALGDLERQQRRRPSSGKEEDGEGRDDERSFLCLGTQKNQQNRRAREKAEREKKLKSFSKQLELLKRLGAFTLPADQTRKRAEEREEERDRGGDRREADCLVPPFNLTSETSMKIKYLQNLYDWKLIVLSQEKVRRGCTEEKEDVFFLVFLL